MRYGSLAVIAPFERIRAGVAWDYSAFEAFGPFVVVILGEVDVILDEVDRILVVVEWVVIVDGVCG